MCGIVAYSGKPSSNLNTLINGLKRLEYRGYDSAGIALSTSKGIYAKKAVGKIVNLEAQIDKDRPTLAGTTGIAHTRWATHGAATIANAHPHSSADKKIWVVHNGIIENYRDLKDELTKQQIKFDSETDSEVVAKLIGNLYKGDLRAAVLQAISKLEGAFSLCVICEDEPDRLIGVKLASPLVVGVATNEIIIASDVSAIIDRTKKVIYLEDGELIDVVGQTYEVVGFENEHRVKKVSQVSWDLEAASKGGHEHFLLKEIMEQPTVIRDSVRGRLVPEKADIKFGGLIDISDRLRNINKVVILGVGTSYYAAKLGELYFNSLSGTPATAALSPEYRYTKNLIDEKTWLIAMSQSGETADTIEAINEAKRHGALVTGIVNVVGSTVARITDGGVYNHIGPEISVASTKAFTSQALLLLMHAVFLGRRDGLSFNAAFDIINAIEKLPDEIQKVLDESKVIEEVAADLYKDKSLLFIGRQLNYPISLEGALKVKELAYIHAEGLSGGELKHGFIALIDKALSTIAIATEDPTKTKMLGNIAEVKARNGKIYAIANEEITGVDKTIIVPKASSEFLQPIVNNIALQVLAYQLAKLKGLNIDQPRNLAKSVTVE